MHFFRNKHRPRSSFEVQIGRSHLLEVTVHLCDPSLWDWYHLEKETIHSEFLELLEASLVPRMYGSELEAYHRKRNPHALQHEEEQKNGRKKRRQQQQQQQQLVVDQVDLEEKDVYFSFGKSIQLAYKKEPGKTSKTILLESQNQFRDMQKLSQRLLVWIDKRNAASEGESLSRSQGIYRPEMIPISDLFRKPEELMVLSEDEDD